MKGPSPRRAHDGRFAALRGERELDNEDELDDSVWDRFCWRYRAEAERLRNFPRLTDRTDAGILAFVDALCAQEGLDDEARVGMFKALRAVLPDPQRCYRHDDA